MGRGKKLISLLGQRLQQLATLPSARGTGEIASQVVHQQQTRSAAAQAATAIATKPARAHVQSLSLVPAVTTDLYGAISAVTEGSRVEEGVYKNQDGHRFEDGR